MKNILLVGLLWVLPLTANSHHSTNANFTQEIITVDGVIEQVRYMNPHASVLIKNTNADGKETYWLLETVGRTTLDRQGMNMDQMVIGSRVTASGRKGRREFTMYLHRMSFEDGSEFAPLPDPN